MPASDQSNVTGGSDFAPSLTTLSPLCSNGVALLGDLTKMVPLSPRRFLNVFCAGGGVNATIMGSAGERVPLTYLTVAGVVRVVDFVVPVSGIGTVFGP